MGLLDPPPLTGAQGDARYPVTDKSTPPTDGQSLVFSALTSKYRPGKQPGIVPMPPVYQMFPAVMPSPPTLAFTPPSATSPITNPLMLPCDTPLVSRRGMVPTPYTGLGYNYQVNGLNAAWTPPTYTIEFEHYGDDFALRFRQRTTNAARVWCWVDDQPATVGPELLTANASNVPAYYRITFPSVALRRVKLIISTADFGGLDIKPTHAVLPIQRATPKLVAYGDSYIGSTGADYEATGLAYRIGQVLSWEVFAAGQGGTGYANDGASGQKGTYINSARLDGVQSCTPDYVLVWGSPNDDALSSTTVGANAATLFTELAERLPLARVIVVGPPRTSGAPNAGRLANRDAIAAAAAEAKNVIKFVDPIAGAWTTGTGKVGQETGDGNADLLIMNDGVHPTQGGHDLFARLTAAAILAAVT